MTLEKRARKKLLKEMEEMTKNREWSSEMHSESWSRNPTTRA